MKLPKSVQIKETTTLFLDKYNYKIVLVCPVAGWFRNRDYSFTRKKLGEAHSSQYLQFCHDFLDLLQGFDYDEYNIRIETPYISFYTNNTNYIESITSVPDAVIKYAYLPNLNLKKLDPGEVVVKRLDFNYKVHLGVIHDKDYSSFLSWADNNPKIRITKKCIRDLSRSRSWGESYFYVKDDKTLTMVKMFLGGDIRRVYRVIKA